TAKSAAFPASWVQSYVFSANDSAGLLFPLVPLSQRNGSLWVLIENSIFRLNSASFSLLRIVNAVQKQSFRGGGVTRLGTVFSLQHLFHFLGALSSRAHINQRSHQNANHII